MQTTQKTLFCHGVPGAGKTIFAAITIDDLSAQFDRYLDIGLAYINFDFQRQGDQKADRLLASLLKKLIQARSCPPESVIALYNWHKDKGTWPTLEEI